MSEPAWLTIARGHLGVREVPGKDTAPAIRRWLATLKAWWSDDETPWCGTFVAACLKQTGYEPPRHWYRAKAYADWGTPLQKPEKGCVVVYDRKGGGHVGFVTAVDQSGRLLTLGGNQGNAVTIAPFDSSRVLAYRWPPGAPPPHGTLPLVASQVKSSNNEA